MILFIVALMNSYLKQHKRLYRMNLKQVFHLVFLCCFFLGSIFFSACANPESLPDASPNPKTIVKVPSNYKNIVTWGKQYKLRSRWVQKDKKMNLYTASDVVSFEAESQKVTINDISFWISYPIKSANGTMYMHQQDISTCLEAILKPKARSQVKIVALDPGHGGKQPGAVSGKMQEKTYVLLIAQEVKRILENNGIKVVMTRSSDKYMGLSERPAYASKQNANLFVSIHLNSAASSKANGVEVFTTTPSGARSTNPDRSGSRARTAGNAYDAYNSLLAYHIQKELVDQTRMTDRGVRRDRLAVLINTKMPAVLVEAGFISNKSDQKKLLSTSERKKIANAIAEGILNYNKSISSSKSDSLSSSSNSRRNITQIDKL